MTRFFINSVPSWISDHWQYKGAIWG